MKILPVVRAFASAALGLAASLTTAASPAASATPPVTVSYGQLEFSPCTLAQSGQAQTVAARCALLRVPENRSNPKGRHIDVSVAWVPSTAKHPAADPVVLLAGGPGQSAQQAFPTTYPAFREILRQRPVLLIDQRGTGRSRPLTCPRTLDAAALRELDTASVDEARRLTAACRDEIGPDVDLRAYTTGDYVADLEDVRRALGVEQFNLIGGSYGTRVGLEYLRRYPGSVRTLVLDSVVPPRLLLGEDHAKNLESAVNAQFARCDADAECKRRFGSPRVKLDELLQRLRQQPPLVRYRDPLSNEMREDRLTDAAVIAVVRFYSYAPQLFGMVPMLLADAGEGRYAALMAQSRMMEQLVGEQIYVPLQLSVSCAEDAPWMRADPADEKTILGSQFIAFTQAQCGEWPRGPMPADFHEPVQSDKPVLLLSGELDPVTPPRYGAEVQRTLSRGRHFVLRGQGHTVMGVGCTPRLIADFIESADARSLDGSCLEQLQYSPPFTGAYGWEP
jgi:pimeloyl-ACP methyl ester carboxylesterase